jgi:transcriptional regulator with XRE-family HTH domain
METVQCVAFGTLLRRYRIAAGLTQEELAKRAGLSGRTVGDMEHGVVHTPRKEELAAAPERVTQLWSWRWIRDTLTDLPPQAA